MSLLRPLPILAFSLLVSSAARGQTPDIPSPPPPPPSGKSEKPSAAAEAPPAVEETPAETPPAVEETPPPPEGAAAERRRRRGPSPAEVEVPARAPRRSAGRLASSLSGETGLYRVASAESVDPGVVRLSFGLDLFGVGSFFREADAHSRVGGTLAIAMSPVNHLEVWLNTRAVSNRNDLTSPQLLQSQGDVSLGVKGFYPVADLATIGADLQVTMLSGVGESSFDLGATEVRMRALLSTDLMRATEQIPVRGHLNIGYTFDNSSNLVPNVRRLSTAERFALGVNDFNRVGLGAAIEVPVKYVTPFLEYTLEVPVGYLATPGIVVTASGLRGAQVVSPPVVDTVALPAVQRVLPQRLTPGLRVTAIPDLTLDVGVEIGLTPAVAPGVPPVPAYNAFVLASYAIDPFRASRGGPSGPPIAVPVIVPEAVAPAASTGRLLGVVRNKADQKVLQGAVITFDRGAPVATAADGRFVSHELEPGPVKVTVSKDGFVLGSAELEIAVGDEAEIEVALMPEVKDGTIRGRVLDDKDKPVAGAQVRLSGAAERAIATADDGTFEAPAPAGRYALVVDKEGFLSKSRDLDLRAGEAFVTDLLIRKRPKQELVERKGDRILVRGQVHFVSGEARLAPDAAALLDNLVDFLVRNKGIRRVRVEGHTDDVGGDARNLELSRTRAEAVVAYLTEQGIEGSRLAAEGFGSSRPIAPNLTRRGREANRRVEFHIVEE